MTSLDAWFDAADGELRAIADRLDAIEQADLARPTPCPGWTLRQLATHVVSVAFRQAEALHRARFNSLEAPSDLVPAVDDLPAALHGAADHTAAARAAMGARRWPPVPLPVATMPVSAAAMSLVVEYGVHRYDVEQALGHDDARPSAATAEALWTLAPGLVALLAKPVAHGPMAYRLRADDGDTLTIGWDGTTWGDQIADGADVCTLAGPRGVLGLLLVNRITPADPRLQRDDPAGVAPQWSQAIGPL